MTFVEHLPRFTKRADKSHAQRVQKHDGMEPNMNELKALIARAAFSSAAPEVRALELAVAAIEVLRDKGTICGNDVCRLAAYLGYDPAELARAWETRADFNIEATRYALEAPIARIQPPA